MTGMGQMERVCSSQGSGLQERAVEEMNNQTQLPKPEEFAAFWRKSDGLCGLWPHVIYLSGMALYAWVARAFLQVLQSGSWRFWLAEVLSVGLAIAYIVIFPYLLIKCYQTRYARFISCPECGNWLGQDWKSTSQTGVCTKCGKRVLAGG